MGIRFDQYQQRLGPWSDIRDQLPFLYDTAAAFDNAVIIELGVRSGLSTGAFLAAVERGGEVWSVDVDQPVVPQDWWSDPHWHFQQGDDLDPGIRANLPAEADIVFIDTSHEYQQTLDELDAYYPRVLPGGMVLMHDTQWLPPARSLAEPGGPVYEALNDWCGRNGLFFTLRKSEPGYYGLGIIRV
jgi:predicted O-methyltransferase YrrM